MTDRVQRMDRTGLRLVTPNFRSGAEEVDFGDFLSSAPGLEDIDLSRARSVVDEAMRRFDDPPASDAWLAPRLHAAIRLTRREAADRGVWRYLCLVWAPDYIRWRWSENGLDAAGDGASPAALERFIGSDTKNALGRLWWNAELIRNGDDYSPVPVAFKYQDIANNFMRMDLSSHRPTAQAFVRVIDELPAGVAHGDSANALAKAANAAATTMCFDIVAPDELPDDHQRAIWRAEVTEFDPLRYVDQLPVGPDDGEVPTGSVEQMHLLLRELLAEAPRRDRAKRQAIEDRISDESFSA